MNDIQVADGDIDFNGRDGIVLSYGDSFFRRQQAGAQAIQRDVNPHSEFCHRLEREIADQIEYIDAPKPQHGVACDALTQLGNLYHWNRQFVNLPDYMSESPDFANAEDATSGHVTHPSLQFMIAR